jgi:hypothetical protein
LERRIVMIKKFKNISYRSIALAITGTLLIGGLVFTKPTYAKQTPINIIKNERESKKIYLSDIAKRLQVEDKIIDKYKTVINKTIIKNNVSITLKEALLRNDELIVTYNINNLKKVDDVKLFGSNLFIDGKEIKADQDIHKELMENNIYQMVSIYQFPEEHKKGDLNIKLDFRMHNPVNFKETGDIWLFEFKMNGDKLANDTKETLINYRYIAEKGAEVNLDKCVNDGMGIKVYYHTKFDKDAVINGSEFSFKCYDDLRNEVERDSFRVWHNYCRIKFSNVDVKRLYFIPIMRRKVRVEDGKVVVSKILKSKQIVGENIIVDL